MTRKLKAVGLAAMAVFAMSAMAAQAAQGAALFRSDSATTIITGSQVGTNEFKVTAGVVKCTTAKFTGTVASASTSTITAHPVYEGCKLAGVNVPVTTTGCDYLFHASEAGTTAEAINATVDVVCTGGAAITVGKEGCIVTVKAQNGIGPVTIKNTNPGTTAEKDVDVTAAANNIVYDQTKECSGGAATAHTGGEYLGTVTVQGWVDNAGVEGARTGIWVE